MTRRTYLNLRERGEALYAAGLDVGLEIIDAVEAADAWDAADDVERIADALGFDVPDETSFDQVMARIKAGNAAATTAEKQAEADAATIAALQAELDRVMRFLRARGFAPPPPADVSRPAVPGAPVKHRGPTLAEILQTGPRPPYGWHHDGLDDDIPF